MIDSQRERGIPETPSNKVRFKTAFGCVVAEKIHESPRTLVYRGRRESDDFPVILKILHREYPTSLERLGFRREYDITRSLQIEGMICVYGLEKHLNTFAMLLEDVGAASLDLLIPKGKFSIEERLIVAVEIATILGRIHAVNVIHKAINPSNILYNPETGLVKIIDFSLATRLPRENPPIISPHALGSGLSYISPEQTGRMARHLDRRTDFYSLGVTLYEMLTRQLPFNARDAMDLVHCHMAKIPQPPHAIDPEIPEALSAMVMKLMAKAPEDRYQSALGIQSDLERLLRAFRQTPHTIDPFPLASHDIPDKLRIPRKLYGRDREVNRLMGAFDRVRESGCELMLVTGAAGVGKTALVHEIQGPIMQNRGYFISGKFDQYQRDVPYSAMIRAFQDLIRQLLTEDEASLSNWRAKLRAALAPNAQVIIDVIPEVELITGAPQEVPDLSPAEAQNRFNLVFLDFIRVFAGEDHPLAIFLDDLQWIDLATLSLLQRLMASPRSRHLIVIGAYRDNKVTDSHPLTATLKEIREEGTAINRIRLSPLGSHEIMQLIGEALKCEMETVRPLAEVVSVKTDGNPFFVRTFLKSLYEENLISFDHLERRWRWSMEQIQEKQIAGDVVALLVGKIYRFKADTKKALISAACLGNDFELETLAMVTGKSPGDTAESLKESVSEGLMVEMRTLKRDASPLTGEEDPFCAFQYSYRFSHDRIQQAAYTLIPASERSALHHKIGQLLLDQLPAETRDRKLFDIVGNLNKGIECLKDPSAREAVVLLNLQAGRKARASAAFEPAYNYFRSGMGLLEQDCWDKAYDLTLAIHVEAAEAAYLSAHFDEMDRLVGVVLERAETLLDKMKAYEVRIQGCIARNRLLEAAQTTLRVMEQLGNKLPEKPPKARVLFGFLRTRLTLFGKQVEELADLPEINDPYKRAAIRIWFIAGPTIYFSFPDTMPLFVFKTINLSMKYGNSPESAIAYATFGLILCAIVGDIDLGYRFGKLAMKVLERFDSKAQEARTIYAVNCVIRHWKEHMRKSSSAYRDAFRIGLQTGAFDFAALSACWHVRNLLYTGEDLAGIKQLASSYHDTFASLGQELFLQQQNIIRQVILNLMGEAENPCDLIGAVYDEEKMLPVHLKADNRLAISSLYSHKSILCYMFGKYEQALENTTMVEKFMDVATGTAVVPLCCFYDSLIRLALLPDIQRPEQRSHLKKIIANQKKMKKWARHAPMNYLHKYYLVEAERDRVCGRGEKAENFYAQAIALAREHEYPNEEALSNELAARYYLSKGKDKIARTYMREAHYGYRIWGAEAKVKDLEKKYPQLLSPLRSSEMAPVSPPASSDDAGSASSPFSLDVTTVVKASQALSSEITLDGLMKTLMKILMENAGAQRGFLILKSDGRLLLEARGALDQDKVTILESVPVEMSEDLPQAVINYVARSQTHVVINDPEEDTIFAKDPYIQSKQPKSILCAPIMHTSRLLGIIYLENNLMTGAFTPERLKIIELLSSQIAISIENARLHTVREEQTRRVKAANLRLEKEIIERKAAEKKFRNIFENAVEGIFQVSPEGRLLTVNPALARIVGFDSAQALMKQIPTLNTGFFVNARTLDTLFTRLRTEGSVQNFETDIYQQDDHIITVMINVHAVQKENHDIALYEGSIKDITETKRAEKLQIEKEAAEAADRAKSAFLAHISHEIRTPMNAILGFINMALNTNLTAKQHRYLDKIRSSSHTLLEIINDILDLSRMAAGKVSLEHVDFHLSEVIARISDMLSGQADEKGISLAFSIADEVPDALRGDPLRLEQVLVNLVYNSIKFTEQGGVKVYVSLAKNAISHAKLEFTVTDTGIGIDGENAEHLFEPFTQEDSSGFRHKGGTGLGLAICKNLVEMMGGQIWARGETGLGSTFGFSIAFDKAKASQWGTLPEPRDPQEIGVMLKGSRVLLAEDDIMNQMMTSELLENEGIVVDTADDGREAVNAAKNTHYDAILMDLSLPEWDGIEATRHIRSWETGARGNQGAVEHVPIIATTGHAMKKVQKRCLEAGMDDYLSKPFDGWELLVILSKWISGEPGSDSNQKSERVAGTAGFDVEK